MSESRAEPRLSRTITCAWTGRLRPGKVLIVVANPSTSTTLGRPVGFWGRS